MDRKENFFNGTGDDFNVDRIMFEHSYFKKRKCFLVEDLEARTRVFFKDPDFTVYYNANAGNNFSQNPVNMCMVGGGGGGVKPVQVDSTFNVVNQQQQQQQNNASMYDGYYQFKRTYYSGAKMFLAGVKFDDNFEMSSRKKYENLSKDKGLFKKALKITCQYFHCAGMIENEKNSSEYKLRRRRIFCEMHARKLAKKYANQNETDAGVVAQQVQAFIEHLPEVVLFHFLEILSACFAMFPFVVKLMNYDKAEKLQNTSKERAFVSCDFVLEKKHENTVNKVFVNLLSCWAPGPITNLPKEIVAKILNIPTAINLNNPQVDSDIAKSHHMAILVIPPLPFGDSPDQKLPQDTRFFNLFTSLKCINNYHFIQYNIPKMAPAIDDTEDHEKKYQQDDNYFKWWINSVALNIKRALTKYRKKNINVPIAVIGWHSGASLAFKLIYSSLESVVNGLVLLNMPTFRTEKSLDIKSINKLPFPIVFVVSQFSRLCNIDTVNEIRCSLPQLTTVFFLSECDDLLYLSEQRKLKNLLSQDIVDLIVVETIRDELLSDLIINKQKFKVKLNVN